MKTPSQMAFYRLFSGKRRRAGWQSEFVRSNFQRPTLPSPLLIFGPVLANLSLILSPFHSSAAVCEIKEGPTQQTLSSSPLFKEKLAKNDDLPKNK